MAAVLVILCLVSLTTGQPAPDFNKQQDGSVRVVIPGFPGVTKVTLTVHGQETQPRFFNTDKAVDGNWQTRIPDVTSKDDDTLYYVIHYNLRDNVHKMQGSVHLEEKSTAVVVPVPPRYLQRRTTVVFSDVFHISGKIDPAKWTHTVTAYSGGSNQAVIFSPEPANSFVRGGLLFIKPTLTVDHFGDDFLTNGNLDVNATWGTCVLYGNSKDNRGCHAGPGEIPPIMSAMLKSKGHIRYGKVTVEARLPRGDWLWPAMWMLSTEDHYGGWPRSGEIDILESRGNENYRDRWSHQSKGNDYAHSAIHYGTSWGQIHAREHHGEYWLSHSTFSQHFHSWWIDWTENYIKLGVDDHVIMAFDTPAESYYNEGHFQGDDIWANGGKGAPFDRPFYLILNVQVAGGWFWPGMVNSPYPQPWNSSTPRTQQFTDFWNARHLWYPTWHGDDCAMRIRRVTMEQY